MSDICAVSVKRAVVWGVRPRRLIENNCPFFFYHEVRGGNFFYLYGGDRTSFSSVTFVSFYKTSYLEDEILVSLRNCVTDVQQHVTCSP